MISSITKSMVGALACGLLLMSTSLNAQEAPTPPGTSTATLAAAPIQADSSTFTVGAQIRPRFEYRHGFKRPQLEGQKAASFVEQRSRIWFDYQTKKFRMHLNLQDIRMWGSTNQIYKSDGSLFNAYEAYGEYFINDKWGVKFGRQALNYDNARFMGNLDWAQQGRSHDAVLVKYENKAKKFKVHIGGGLNQFQNEPTYLSFSPYPNANNKYMTFVWARKEWKKLSASFLFHNDGIEQVNVAPNADTLLHNRQTLAFIPTYKLEKVKLDGEFYYQLGKNGGGQDVSAYFIAIAATFDTKITPITVGGDFASGTQWDADNNTDNSWNPLYGTNHKFYGYMDYFYVGNGHGQAAGRNGGLIDLFVKTNFKLGKSKKHFLGAHLHYFMSPVELVDLTDPTLSTTVSSGLGTEIDLVWKWKISKGVVGNVGYSQMFATESMQQIKGQANDVTGYAKTAGMNNWAWMQINFNTELFQFKHKN